MQFYNEIDKFADNTAFTDGGKVLSYAELIADSTCLSEYLPRNGLIFNLCDNCIEALVGYITFLRKGMAQALINSNLDTDLMATLINKYKPQYVWTSGGLGIMFPGYVNVFSYGGYILLEAEHILSYPINPQLALLLTTSGSTGSPKFVRQSFKNISHNAESIAEYLEITQTNRPITTLPMSYTFGLSIINSHLLKGCTIVLTNKKLIDSGFWKLFEETVPTTFSGVPFTFQMLKSLNFEDMPLPSLNVITQAGGKLPEKLAVEFAEICLRKNIRFVTMYGQTEATARMSYLPHQYAVEKAGSIGIPIPRGEMWLVDDTGKTITEPDDTGELVYKGDNVALGYSNDYNDLSLGDENGGVLHTGDIAKKDIDGFYYIVGRKKRFLKIFGNRINLDELQNLFYEIGIETVVTGTDDDLRIFTTNSSHVSVIKDYMVKKVGLNIVGFSVHCIEEIPHTKSGKVDFGALPNYDKTSLAVSMKAFDALDK